MKFKITPEIIGIISLIISVLLILIVFVLISKYFTKKTDKFSHDMPVHYSNGAIDIRNKKVIIRELSKVRKGEMYVYDLEDFIYMLSINPDSKPFRELLKLINNGSTTKKILDKLNTIPNSFAFIIDYHNKRRTLALVNMNPIDEEELDNEIHFQIMNNELTTNPAKSHFGKDFLENALVPETDTEIFSSLIKATKRFITKGVTIIKISPKHAFIESEKDYLLNIVQLTTIKRGLEKQGIESHLGRDGSLYAIAANDRRKNFFAVQRAWEIRITSIFAKIKRNEYIDGNFDYLNINTYMTMGKDSKSINEALIFVNLISDYQKRGEDFDYDDLLFEARSINVSADEIVKSLKEKKPPIKSGMHSIIERGVKPINEVYIDYPREIMEPLIKYSFKHKKEILETLYKAALKESTKDKEHPVAVQIDLFSIPEIYKVIETEKARDNLYIILNEKDKIKHFKNQLTTSAKKLKDNGIKTMQLVNDELGGSINLYRIFKSEYILLAKGLNESTILSDKLKMNINNIINNKEKETKIINMK